MRTVQILTAAFAASIIPLVSSASDPVNPMFETKAARPPGLVQPGALVKGCSGWIKATPGMTCEELAGLLNIDMKQLLLQNPQIANGDCVHNFWADYYYCTG
ncbi:hypothetical protein GGR51DRAFT_75942 [Nemania sp. FL0031]|nr:hypothetical protein GGR51DRAFT_75942 [Nemania sp. FL0031]